MVFKFVMFSDEVDDFRRDVVIDSDATFLQFLTTIYQSIGYNEKEMSSFLICNHEWEAEHEITLIDMGASADDDPPIMENTKLNNFLEEEHQRLRLVFDVLNERSFYIELNKLILNQEQLQPEITKTIGEAPVQTIPLQDFDSLTPTKEHEFAHIDDYGSDFQDDYNEEDFEGLDEASL